MKFDRERSTGPGFRYGPYSKAMSCLLTCITLVAGILALSSTPASAGVTAAAAAVTVDDSVTTGTNHFTYTGSSWTNCGGCVTGAYRNAFRYAYATGNKAVFSFIGTQVDLYGYKEPAGGIASLSVDGGRGADRNFFYPKRVETLMFRSPVLRRGYHTITITVTGRKAGGTSPTINIDRANLTSAATGWAAAPKPVVTPPKKVVPPKKAPVVAAGKWLSGESNSINAKDGSFAAWRGRYLDIGGTWGSTADWASMEASPWWTVGPDGAWAGTPRMDYAMNAWPENIGSSQNWAPAASGVYDAHWTTILKNLKAAWGSRAASNMYIRFEHEMNGNWYNHSVPPAQIANFKAAWVRIHNLIRKYFPGAKLVWSVNHESAWNYSVTALWPGDANVDVVSMDSYNNYSWCNTEATCTAKFNATQNGGPAGLESLRRFALAHGKPFAVSEWSSAAVNNGGGGGDAPGFMQAFHNWLVAHGGAGPGKVQYEVLFNIPGFGDHYEVFQNGAASRYEPLAAATPASSKTQTTATWARSVPTTPFRSTRCGSNSTENTSVSLTPPRGRSTAICSTTRR